MDLSGCIFVSKSGTTTARGARSRTSQAESAVSGSRRIAARSFCQPCDPVLARGRRCRGCEIEKGRPRHGDDRRRQSGPEANEHADRLDLARRPNRHLAFGTGVHFCLGHQLARIEATCALQALFTRWPKLKLAVDPSRIHWRKRPGIRMIAALPVVAGS